MRVLNGAPPAAGRAPSLAADLTTLQFVAAWATEQRAMRRGLVAREGVLSHPEVALVVRQVARLLGDRPLRAVTLGELARLSAVLEEAGMSPAAAFGARRALSVALRGAVSGAPGSPERRPISRLSARGFT